MGRSIALVFLTYICFFVFSGLEGVLVGSPGMAPHVLPMLLDKLSSEVSTAKEASLKALVAGVRAFGAPGVGVHLRAIGGGMFEEVRARNSAAVGAVCFSSRCCVASLHRDTSASSSSSIPCV